jgi:uncharacterized membrane protein
MSGDRAHMSHLQLQLHPMMVHFPLALTITGALCLLCARLLRESPLQGSLAAAGTWNLILGGVSALPTLGSGLGAALHLHLSDGAQYSVSRHVIWAVCTSQLIILLAIWRGVARTSASRPSWLFLAFLFIACAGLIVTGYHGGENVYHYGLGVGANK